MKQRYRSYMIFGVAESGYDSFFNKLLKLRVGAIHELPLPLISGAVHTSIQQRLK
jgi:hypothetical protein